METKMITTGIVCGGIVEIRESDFAKINIPA
jgi:hypothetical protein